MDSSSLDPQPKKRKMISTTDDEGVPNKIRFKRRKIAIFLAYCGLGYQGMQRNPGAKTIEGDLEQALFKSGAISESDYGDPRKIDWARSARTDKGVSAVGQVVSGRFFIDPPGLIDRLNSNLPAQVRIFGFKRVTASFNAKKFCDRRRYVYLLPVFALDPNSHPNRESVMASRGSENELVKCLECSERGRKVEGVMGRRNERKIMLENGENLNFEHVGAEILEGGNVCNGSGTVVEEPGSNDRKFGVAEGEKVGVGGDACNCSGTVIESTGDQDLASCKSGFECMDQSIEEKGSDDCKLGVVEEAAAEKETIVEALDAVKTASIFENGSNAQCVNSSNDNADGEEFCKGSMKEEENDGSSVSRTEESHVSQCNGNGNTGELLAKKCGFCYAEKEKERFNSILKQYVGTHNFHNFTSRTKAEDPSAQRYIVSFEANDVISMDGIEFVKCVVVGQSFMLHQIRKMIGLAVAIMRNCAPDSLMATALKKDVNVNVPTAPELGLFLAECLYTSYNQKWRDSHEELSLEEYADEVEDFMSKYIYSHIASTEQKEGVLALWLHSLNRRNYADFCLVEAEEACASGEFAQMDNAAE